MKCKVEKFCQAIKSNKWIILGIIVVLVFIYGITFVQGYKLSYTNLMYNVAPWNSENIATKGPFLSDVVDSLFPNLYSTIKSLNFTGLWNPNIGLGAPEDVGVLLYPLNYLYLLPLEIAIPLNSLLQYIFGFLGIYLLLKEYGVGKIAASTSGVIYTFSSALVMWHGWPHSDVAVLAPFLFLFIEKFLKDQKVKYVLGMTIFIYLMLVAGMPTYAAYFMYLAGIYIVVYNIKRNRKEWKKVLFVFLGFSTAVIVAVLISLPYTGSLLFGLQEYAESRKGLSSVSLDLSYLWTMFYPYVRDGLTMHINESTIYSGIFAIIMMVFTIFNVKNKRFGWFWAIASLILLLLIFTGLFDSIFTHMPAINTSHKRRVIVLFNFSVAMTAGINFNDLIENKAAYFQNKRIMFLLPLLGIIILILSAYRFNGIEVGSSYLGYIRKFVFMLLLLIFLFMMWIWKDTKISKYIPAAICILVIIDMGSFAKNYVPLIENTASILPEATDTIEYLQDNTAEGERIAGVGSWTLFPSTNIYYQLKDTRGHNFVFTNQDIKSYYTSIDDECYQSRTRVVFTKMDNENLLKYMGVKYIVGAGQASEFEVDKALSPIYENMQVVQSFIAEKDNLNSVALLLATYGHTFDDEIMKITIMDSESQEGVCEEKIDLSTVQDNSYITVNFPAIGNSKEKEYTITIETDTSDQNSFTVWTSSEVSYNGELTYNGEPQDNNIVLALNYGIYSYTGDDGLLVEEMEEYSENSELISNVVIVNTEAEILKEMEADYNKNTLYLSEELNALKESDVVGSNSEIKEDEYIATIEESDNYKILEASVAEERFIILNDYYDDDWKAYVNGEEVEIYKGNYLFRAIQVPAGTCTIEFRYEPETLYMLFYISAAGLCIFIALIVFRKKLQKLVDNHL